MVIAANNVVSLEYELLILGLYHNQDLPKVYKSLQISHQLRVSVQGVKALGGHFACLCRGFDFYEVKKNIIIF